MRNSQLIIDKLEKDGVNQLDKLHFGLENSVDFLDWHCQQVKLFESFKYVAKGLVKTGSMFFGSRKNIRHKIEMEKRIKDSQQELFYCSIQEHYILLRF